MASCLELLPHIRHHSQFEAPPRLLRTRTFAAFRLRGLCARTRRIKCSTYSLLSSFHCLVIVVSYSQNVLSFASFVRRIVRLFSDPPVT
jgi:hypothetical protein